jgi:hypothetical protein
MSESLQEIINRLWTTPEHAEWAPKTDVLVRHNTIAVRCSAASEIGVPELS